MSNTTQKYWTIIPAAGSATRMQAKLPKQYLPLLDKTVFERTLTLFIDNPKPSAHKSASWDNMFATHPPIEKRIELLEQFV